MHVTEMETILNKVQIDLLLSNDKYEIYRMILKMVPIDVTFIALWNLYLIR